MIEHLEGLEISSIYDFDNAFSINELLCKFWEKIEETTDISNECIDILNWIKEQGLPDEVKALITQLVEDGTMERIINVELFNNLKTQLEANTKKLYYREKEQTLITNFYNKLIKNENVSIGLYGDSETYGYDVSSDDKRENSVTDNAGNVYTTTIASKTYPEAFKETLDKVYGANKVSVTVRAIGGDYVQKALGRWLPKTHPIGTDICIMNYGVNDSRLQSCPYVGDTNEFLKYYREFIETELDNGTGIILMTPFKMRTTDIRVQVFETAVINLAKEYDIPVIIGDELTANLSYSYYSDGTHFNGKGYEILGVKVANCFVGNGFFNPITVNENTQLLSRRQLDGIWWNPNDSEVYNVSSESYPTPDESGDKKGIVTRIGENSSVYYTFYAEKDLWIVPYLGYNMEDSYAVVDLDFGIDTPDFSFDNYPFLGQSVNFETRALSTVTYSKDMFKTFNRVHVGSVLVDELPCLRTVTKGWHTISITARGGSMALGGLIFLDINYFETIRNKYTKFRNNIVIEPTNIDDYRDLTIYREDSDGLKSVRIGTNLKSNKASATLYLYNENTKEVISEFNLKDNEAICDKTIRLYPQNMNEPLSFSSVRQLNDGETYYQNSGLFQHNGSLAVGSCLYDYNSKKELSRFMTGVNSVSACKMNGTDNPLPGEIDLGTSYYQFKDIYSSNGVIQTSDLNAKKDIVDTDLGLNFINKLRPVNFKFINNQSERVHSGLIAQEVESVLMEDKAMLIKDVVIDEKGDKHITYGLRYNELIAPLIKAIQELSQEVENLKKNNNL